MELAKTSTGDGLRLDGAWYPAEGASGRAAVCLHGAGSNFYAGGLWERLVEPLQQAGWNVLRVNTRGHDGYYATRTALGAARLGAAYELVADCTLDIPAWLDWLAERGLDRVALLGHSLGAIKAVYCQAVKPDPRVAAVVAISPPRLSGSAFRAGEKSHEFGPTLREAQRLLAAGEPQALLESKFPFPMLITAESYIDKYGAEKYNIVPLAPQLAAPATFIYGQRELDEGGIAFSGLPAALRAARRPDQQLNIQIVSDADHFYIGCYDQLNAEVLAGLNCASP